MKRTITLFALAGLTLLSLPARAQFMTMPAGAERQKSEVTVGTGLLGFFSGSAGGTGGSWEARYGYRVIPLLTIEGGYLGAAADAPGPGGTVATIIEGDAKVNPLRNARLNPYAVAGLGWGAFSGFGGQRSDNSTLTIPLGGGFDYQVSQHISAGTRAVFRATAADHIGNLRAHADNWALTARLGATF